MDKKHTALANLRRAIPSGIIIAIVGVIIYLMVSFFFAFINESSTELAFNMASIVAETDASGEFSVTFQIGSGLLPVIIVAMVLLVAVFFIIYQISSMHKAKKDSDKS